MRVVPRFWYLWRLLRNWGAQCNFFTELDPYVVRALEVLPHRLLSEKEPIDPALGDLVT
jgi:hypothetical protein